MITLKEGLLNKKNIKNIEKTKKLKYDLKESDRVGFIKDFPLGVIDLAIEETLLQYKKLTPESALEELQKHGIGSVFIWSETTQGRNFWYNIDKGNYDEYYKLYEN